MLRLGLEVGEDISDTLVQRSAAVALEHARDQSLPGLLGAGQGATAHGLEPDTWTALILMVVPVHAISRGGSTTSREEVSELGPDFHRNTEPGSSAPSSIADRTSGFHDGHSLIPAITENTVCGSALIRILPSAVAGAFRLISMPPTL